jgi:hypothetical protein
LAGDWSKMPNGQLYDKQPSPNIIPVFKSSWIRWAGHVECMGEKRYMTRGTCYGLEHLKGRRYH